MEILSNELITIILSYLSQKQLVRASLVCKKWHQITLCPTFYETIYIYSEKQLVNFLSFAKTKKTKNHIPLGHFVYHLFYFGKSISPSLFYSLNDICPNITFINDVSINNDNNSNSSNNSIYIAGKESQQQQHLSKHLKHINLWYTKYYINWMDNLGEGIESLQLCVDKKLIDHNNTTDGTTALITFQKDYPPKLQRNRILVFYMDDDDIKEHQKSIGDTSVEAERTFRNHLNEYISRSIHNIYNNNSTINGDENNNGDEVQVKDFYGQVLVLSTAQWIHLTTLYIDFCDTTCSQYTPLCGIDERSFDSIMTSCPSLTSLILNCMDMVLSSDYDNAHVLPSPSLSHLELQHSNLQDPLIYDYFSIKFPELNTLKIELQTSKIYPPHRYQDYKDALYRMIIQYKDLTTLTMKMDEQDFYRYNKFNRQFWPVQELNEWLMNHPYQLKHLETWYEFIKDRNTHHSMKYLNHLKTLSLANITDSPSILLNHKLLNNSNQQSYASTSITTLKLKSAHTYMSKNDSEFDLEQWLNAFPNLRELSLKRMGRIVYGKGNIESDQQQQQQEKEEDKCYNSCPLEILDLCQTNIKIQGGLSELCNLFPNLRALYLTTVCFFYDYPLSTVITKDHYDEELNAIVIEAGRWDLDELELFHVDFDSTEVKKDTSVLIEYLTVEERLGSGTKSYGDINSGSISSHHLYFKCNSVERIIF
ncbi:hypothetical protein BJ944DRAFT_258213 [Cunninghamella echinulata]|nr:hypothetical protein BJ944DRAFT_258213 [Cunninghamella echinulata]